MDREFDELVESLETLLSEVPGPVRNFVLNNLGKEALRLSSKYSLHVDLSDELYKNLLLLLLGQQSPSDFSNSLKQAGLPSDTVVAVVADVNESIFKKLRSEEMVGESLPGEKPVNAYGTTSKPTQAPLLKIESLSREPGTAGGNLPRSENSAEETPLQHNDYRPPHPWQTSPARSFQTASVPYTSVPYISQPVESKPAASSQPQTNTELSSSALPTAEYIPPSPPPPTPVPPNPLSREYALDPYREPIQ